MTKEDFIKDSQGYGSHRKLLWLSLEATKHLNLPVMELGCGDNSTPFLRKYCDDNGLELFSYDYNKEWADKFQVHHIKNWNRLPHNINAWINDYSVVLVDESPGEHRKESIAILKGARILVVHDSEPPGWNASDYRVRPLFSKFKYMIDDIPKEKGAPWTTALSNTIDVSKFVL